MESLYLVDENNNNMASTMISSSGPNNNNNNNNNTNSNGSKSIGVAQQVVMVASGVSSGSSSSLNSNSSCSSTTSSGNSSASSTTSLASNHQQDYLVQASHHTNVSGLVKLDPSSEAPLLQPVNERGGGGGGNPLNNSNNFNSTASASSLITTTTTTSNSNNNNGIQAPKPRGRRKKIRTEPIRPICPQCEKQFSNQSALTKHKLTHSDERKFACQQCSKAFKRHDHLTGHMQTHSNRKPFNCTIQGCDKTYCDARSLRRHKENIHHIVAPRDCNNNNNGTATGLSNNINDTNTVNYQQSGIKNEQSPSPGVTSSTTATQGALHHQQPSHLLRRRIQRLHSDPGGQFDEPTGRIFYTDRHLANTNHHDNNDNNHNHHHPYSQTPQLNPTHNHHHHHMQLQHQQHHDHQQASSFSADYATTQHFFDFNQMAPVEQQYCASVSMTHSVDSINDSSLGLQSVHYEPQQQPPMTPSITHDNQQRQHDHNNNNNNNSGYLTPTATATTTTTTTLHPPPPTPTFNAPNDQQQQNYQHQQMNSTAVHQQPSQLLRKRIQRLRSDPGGPHHELPALSPDLACRPTETNRRSADLINHHYHHQQAPYSADYASTQHFSFDFNHQMGPGATLNQQYCNGHTVGGSTGTIPPLSADSNADSSIELSIHYEQQTMTPNHHHHSGYITPITPNTQHPATPNMLAPPQSAPAQQYVTSVNTHQQSQPGYQQQQQQPQTVTLVPPPSFTSSGINQQPSHLLRRRIQRFQSDPGEKIENVACRPIETQRRSIELTNSDYRGYNNNHHHHHHQQQQHTHHHHHDHQQQQTHHQQQQASFSADYASTQHFSFEFTSQMAPMDQQFCQGSTIPHSADSINDSSLGLSVHYEQLTPNSGNQQQQHASYTTPNTISNDQHQQMIITSPH